MQSAKDQWNTEVLSSITLPESTGGVDESRRQLLYTVRALSQSKEKTFFLTGLTYLLDENMGWQPLYNHAVLPSDRTDENPGWNSSEPYYDGESDLDLS